jgi:hypothetical protein
MIVVYKITNLTNEKIYIGVHRCTSLNDNYYGSGKLIRRALKKYGKENFSREYLHIFNDNEVELAFEKEREYVTKEFTLRADTYNISEGGHTNPVMYGEYNPFYGKTHTQETLDQIQKSRSWYEMSEETKKKISLGGKLNWSDSEYRIKMIEAAKKKDKSYITEKYVADASERRKGASMSDETKQKIREQKIGVSWGTHTEETKQYLSDINKGRDVSEWIDKVNKNPEKIRKTAETHTGMKRSEEAKQNMKEAQKKRFENEPVANKGKVWIHNPLTKERRYAEKDEQLPKGFQYGLGKRNI